MTVDRQAPLVFSFLDKEADRLTGRAKVKCTVPACDRQDLNSGIWLQTHPLHLHVVMRQSKGFPHLISSDNGVLVITLLSLTSREEQEESADWPQQHRGRSQQAPGPFLAPAPLPQWHLLVTRMSKGREAVPDSSLTNPTVASCLHLVS